MRPPSVLVETNLTSRRRLVRADAVPHCARGVRESSMALISNRPIGAEEVLQIAEVDAGTRTGDPSLRVKCSTS
jgi:hypothetical protein